MGLQDISIRLKLYSLTIGGVLGTLLALGVLFLLMQSSTGTLSRALKLVMDGDTRLFELINDVASSQGLLQQINREKDADNIETLATRYVDTIASVDKRIHADFPAEQEPCRQIWLRLRSVNQSALDMALKGQQAMALQLLASESNPLFEKLLAEIEVHRKDVHQEQSAAMERSTRQVNTMLAVFAAVMAGMFIALLFFGLYISRSITRPIGATADMLKLIAQGQGDLTRRLAVTSRDEVGGLAHWFNEFISQLEGIIHRIKTSAVEADESTQQVSSESQGLAKSTQEQAAAVEEVAATIEQMASLIKENAHNAAQGLDVTTTVVAQANESEQLAHELMAAMQEVLEASKRIGDIIATVNEVAFQTNLLALNAAVEAARAGEHGKGFSVVADEVRALAGRSSEAARQIRTLIQETMDKVARSDSMVSRSNTSIKEIRASIQALSQRMQEIAASSAEQAGGVESVNKAISQIDTMTQQNASTVEQLAAMAENLSLVANNLARTVERFTVGQAQ